MEITGFKKINRESFNYPELGIGIIGYGFMGKTHANAYKKVSYLCWPPVAITRLVAVCGKPELGNETKEAAYRFGYEGYYIDYKLMAEDPRINLIDNCAPDDLHYGPVMAAIKAGKNIICEKPLAMSVKDAKEMYISAKNAKIKHMVGHNYRFIPAVRLAKDLIDKGYFGRIYEFRGKYLQSYGSNPKELIENVWYASGTKSGINLGIGSHIIDMSRFLMGEIKTISAIQKTFNRTMDNSKGQAEKVDADECNLALV
jgi:predicted dehydrogenase